MTYIPTALPPQFDFDTKAILKKIPAARAALAELKGIAATIPNVSIILNTLALQEAKDSSAVENIITTHDELFKAELNLAFVENLAAKEVQHYADALKKGFYLVDEHKIITNRMVLDMHQVLEGNDAGYRKVPGTELRNDATNEVVYTPPQNGQVIQGLMTDLVEYINDDEKHDVDPLVKMAIIHHQFESIHPFYDGNGRCGRIINILYLVAKELIDLPILYLSRYIIQNKADYYRLLQQVRDRGTWEEWVLYILEGIEVVARQSIELIKNIKDMMMQYKHHIRAKYNFYSQDLVNNLFKHPYTKIEFLQDDLKISRQSASRYLNELANDEHNILDKVKMGKYHYFINTALVNLFLNYNYRL
jgi:Fic family protein